MVGFNPEINLQQTQTDEMDSTSRKLTRTTSNRNKDSSIRQPVRAHDLRPGNIVWLPRQSEIENSHMIRQFEHSSHNVQRAEIDQALPESAYNHPVVALEIKNFPSSHSNGDDDYVIVSLLTSFGATTGSEDTCRLQARRKLIWDSYLAIHPSRHPSRPDFQLLHLQKGKLEKPSYVELGRIYMPISVLKTYRPGRTATASAIKLTRQSLDILLREVGIKAPQSSERGLSGTVGTSRATTAAAIIPLSSPSLPMLSTQTRILTPPRGMPQIHRPQIHRPQIVVPNNNILAESEPGPSRSGASVIMPSSPTPPVMRSFADIISSIPHNITTTRAPMAISAREDTLLITSNTHRLFQPVTSLSHTSDNNYGSIDDWSLPPPITWNNPRGRRISNSIGRTNFIPFLKVALYLSILGVIVCIIPWPSIASIITKIGHFFASIWSSCWGFVAKGCSSFINFFRNTWHTFVAWWLKSLEKTSNKINLG